MFAWHAVHPLFFIGLCVLGVGAAAIRNADPDRARITKLAALLHSAAYASPNHPRGGWSTLLSLDDGRQKHSAIIRSTGNNGVLIQIGKGGIGRDFREEALGVFLEGVARTGSAARTSEAVGAARGGVQVGNMAHRGGGHRDDQ